MIDDVPIPLRSIYEAVNSSPQPASNLDSLQPIWEEHAARALALIPDIHIEGGGEILCLGELSPGCRACKEGVWDCVFVTMRCNIACPFCYSPHSIPADFAGSAFGATPEQIAANHHRTRIAGISFSGGEPFSRPQTLFDWIAKFKALCPDKYYWVYTNGLLASEEYVRRLGELGIDEIRFNLAATGYTHRAVLKNVAAAARYIPNLTVEIPAIPEHRPKLLAALSTWSALGVRFLNLHELMYEPGTNAAALPGPRRAVVTADGHHTEIHPESRALMLAVMQRVNADHLPLSVNDCSLQSKLRQLRGRRRSLAPLMKAAHERMIDDEAYETYCVYEDDTHYRFCHPEALPEMRTRYFDCRYFRLVRSAPLALTDPGRWIAVEELRDV